jgi:hypothetical protein
MLAGDEPYDLYRRPTVDAEPFCRRQSLANIVTNGCSAASDRGHLHADNLPYERGLAHPILIVVWLTAAAGIVLKLGWPERFHGLLIYPVFGWSGILAHGPIVSAPQPFTLWAPAGS